MTEAPKKILEPAPPAPPAPILKPQIDTHSYTLGFTKGYKEGDSMIAGLAFGICGVLAIVCAFVILWRHISRMTEPLERLHAGILEKLNSKTCPTLLLPFILTVCLAGCAGKQTAAKPVPPAPLPPQTAQTPAPEQPKTPETDAKLGNIAGEGQALTVYVPADQAEGPRRGEPEELAELLEMKSGSSKDTAVSLMRPSAIREAAQLVTLQTAVAWRYKRLLEYVESYSGIMDTAFNFSPLLMTHGDALIMPPVLTRAGASMRIEKPDTATSSKTSYELLAPARYVPAAPHWREFLMTDGFPAPEKPNPAVMPKDDKERAIWRTAVREAWAQGVKEADQLFADNVARMAREYRGVMLYHLLTAQHLLSKVGTASADLGMKTSDGGNKLHIGQKVYRLTARPFLPSRMPTCTGKAKIRGNSAGTIMYGRVRPVSGRAAHPLGARGHQRLAALGHASRHVGFAAALRFSGLDASARGMAGRDEPGDHGG
jgi:hypothetical protein